MPSVQTSYNGVHAPAYAGMVANQEPRTVISRVVANASGLGFGVIAVQGAGDDQVQASVAGAGAPFRGVSIVDLLVPAYAGYVADTYAQGAIAAVMTKGVVWVVAAGPVAAGAPAFFDPATGALSADNSHTAIDGTFDSSGAAGALVKLRLN